MTPPKYSTLIREMAKDFRKVCGWTKTGSTLTKCMADQCGLKKEEEKNA